MLGDLGVRGFTGKVVIDAGDKQLSITFQRGAIVDAFSPLPSDSPLRAALTGHFISSAVVSSISRRIAASPGKDEINVIAEAANLQTDHVRRLRARVVMARATRTFGVESGVLAIEESAMPANAAMPQCALDVRQVVYQGARMHLSELRLAAELRQLGGVFALRPDAPLAAYELSAAEQPVIAALRRGTTLAELELAHREVDPRAIQVLVYTLVSCGAARGNGASPAAPVTVPVVTRAPTGDASATVMGVAAGGRAPAMPRTVTPTIAPLNQPAAARAATEPVVAAPRTITPSAVARTATGTTQPQFSRTMTPTQTPAPQPTVSRLATGSTQPQTEAAAASPPAVARTQTPTAQPRTSTTRPGSTSSPFLARTMTPRMTATDLATLVTARSQLIAAGADFFAILGLAMDAPAEAVRVAHLRLAALLQAPHLALVGYDDTAGAAKRLLEHVETAYHVLGDQARRTAYVAAMSRTNDGLPAARARTYEEVGERSPAYEAYHRGQLALRSELPAKAAADFAVACEHDPTNVEYQSLHIFAKFCAAGDRDAVAVDTRKAFERLVHKSDHPAIARYFLGRVERMLGRDREALRQFREVLALLPDHAEAALEVRVLEQRLERGSKSLLR